MKNKKLGVILVAISLIVGGMFVYYSSSLLNQGREIGCFPNEDCIGIERALNFSHAVIGVFSFLLALGFYLMFFDKSEKAILDRLESDKNQKIEDMKFDILMKALDPFERKVMKTVRSQDGITQSTLRIKTDMSKAKLSYVLSDLEKKGLIKRVRKGKTLSVHLKI
jgi:uncharacterized membrane protein